MVASAGAKSLTRKDLDELVGRLVADAAVDPGDVLALTFVGNPIMHHLLLGIDPVELGSAPFTLATDGPVRTTAGELGLALHAALDRARPAAGAPCRRAPAGSRPASETL